MNLQVQPPLIYRLPYGPPRSTHRRADPTPRRPPLRTSRIRRRRCLSRAAEDESEGPLLERLDVSSDGGLGGTSEDVFGPLAVLLVGFQLQEYRQFRSLLQELGAEFVSLIPCPPSHLTSPLEAVLKLDGVQFQTGPLGLRRTVFLSGMYASEVQEIVSAYHDLQLPNAVFAACVPRNKDKRICDLVEEVYDDHEYMIQQRNRNSSLE